MSGLRWDGAELVAIQFFILAPYVGVEAIRALAGGEHPDVSELGGLTAGSIRSTSRQKLVDF